MQELRNWQRMQNRCTWKFFNHVLLFLKLYLIFLQLPLLLFFLLFLLLLLLHHCCFVSQVKSAPASAPAGAAVNVATVASASVAVAVAASASSASGVTVDICAPGVISVGGIRRTSYAPGSSSGQRCFPFVITFCWLQCFVLGFTNWTADATTHKDTHTNIHTHRDIDRTQRQLHTHSRYWLWLWFGLRLWCRHPDWAIVLMLTLTNL